MASFGSKVHHFLLNIKMHACNFWFDIIKGQLVFHFVANTHLTLHWLILTFILIRKVVHSQKSWKYQFPIPHFCYWGSFSGLADNFPYSSMMDFTRGVSSQRCQGNSELSLLLLECSQRSSMQTENYSLILLDWDIACRVVIWRKVTDFVDHNSVDQLKWMLSHFNFVIIHRHNWVAWQKHEWFGIKFLCSRCIYVLLTDNIYEFDYRVFLFENYVRIEELDAGKAAHWIILYAKSRCQKSLHLPFQHVAS